MTTFQKTLIRIAVVAVLAAPFLIQHNELTKVRAENESLHQKLDLLTPLANQNELVPTVSAQSNRPSAAPVEASHELLRLRGEVGLLRQQNQGLAKLLSESQQTGTTRAFEPSSSWMDVGNATPQAAASTFAWAIKTGATDKLAEVLLDSQSATPETSAVVAKIAAGLQSFMAEIDGSRIVFTDDNTPDQVTFWFQNRFKDGSTLVSPLTLKQVAGVWKVRLVVDGVRP